MKRWQIIIPVISLVLNLYWFTAWTYVFYTYGTQEKSVNIFEIFLGGFSATMANIILMIILLISIIILHQLIPGIKGVTKTGMVFFLVIQYLFLILHIWGHL